VEGIAILRDTSHWGQITVEVRDGKVHRVNITTNLKPASEKMV